MLLAAFNVSFSLNEALLALLLIAGIVALVFLVKLFISISKITDSIARTLQDNKVSLDETIRDIPKITNNVNNTLENTNKLIEDVEPSIVSTLENVSNVTSQVSNVTTNISDTVEVVGMSVADTASKFTSKVSNATDYLALAKGIASVIFRKK